MTKKKRPAIDWAAASASKDAAYAEALQRQRERTGAADDARTAEVAAASAEYADAIATADRTYSNAVGLADES